MSMPRQSGAVSRELHVQQLRIEKACGLLDHSHILTNVIDYKVGYQDISAFNRVFRTVTSLTASEEFSFTKAAERLGMGQSAVIHRIRSLEEALGHTLFDRTTRQLRFTEIGKILCHATIDTVTKWDAALDKVKRSQSTNLIQLSLPSSLAMKWLIPALRNAQAMNLNISAERTSLGSSS
jgi:hypothetical protein